MDKGIFVKWGRYSYNIYMNHLIFSTLLTVYIKDVPYCIVVIMYIILITIGAVLMEKVKDGFIKAIRYVNN